MTLTSRISRMILISLAVFMGLVATLHGQQNALNLMPQPAQLTPRQGRLPIDGTFRVALAGYEEPRLRAAAERLISRLARQTGIQLNDELATDASPDASPATLRIECGHAGEAVQSFQEDESYTLEVSPKQARLQAPTPVGALRGMETFLQLVDLDADGFGVPAVEIHDQPRFPWRGLMMDVSRHWMPIEVIERNLDGMAAVKLNVFHWHLSDDQGFRVESKTFPKLQGMGSDGHYYTQAQVKEVIAYARDRGIRVVPEFDMPGHTTAWFVGYPELASGPGPYQVERRFGVFDPAMDPTRDEIYKFLDAFIGEMAALFPDEYFHVGGDEVNGKQWKGNPRIQAFMQQHALRSTADLQTYFSGRVLEIVERHGKKTIGWDEVLHPGLPKNIVVQSWRGQQSLATAARQGYMGILSWGYYLDLMEPASRHYRVDPLEGATAGLTAEEKARILGGEACMWVELANPGNVDSRIWPRMAAIAERLWSPQPLKDVDSMYRRLAVVSRELGFVGLTHQSYRLLMLERLTEMNSAETLASLDSVLEPVKGYSRLMTRDYTIVTPLNRLVDATPPESDAARELATLVANWKANEGEIRKRLTRWHDSAADLVPMMKQNFLLREDVPLAEDVSAAAAAGLQALDYLKTGQPAPASWVTEQLGVLARAAKPRDALLIMIAPSIKTLVEAAK